MIVYDQPAARRHRVAGFAPSPDRQRPGMVDPRVVVADCGLVIALTGHPKDRPARIERCCA